jgi:hypothetical protein
VTVFIGLVLLGVFGLATLVIAAGFTYGFWTLLRGWREHATGALRHTTRADTPAPGVFERAARERGIAANAGRLIAETEAYLRAWAEEETP